MEEFQQFVGQHKADKYSKKLKCKNQLSILLYAQAKEKDKNRKKSPVPIEKNLFHDKKKIKVKKINVLN